MGRWVRLACAFALLFPAAGVYAQADAAGPSGDWHATLAFGALKVRLALHLGAQSTFDSPDQGAMGLPAETIVGEDGKVTVKLRGAGTFEGSLTDNDAVLSGTYTQGAAQIPARFERGDFPERARPQTPMPPFPYRSEEAHYPNPAEPRLTLAGTLTIPPGEGPFPAVLLITGSGKQDRDETLFGHKPFLLLADALARRGVAVLRVDDRGIGGSGAGEPGATTASFATDAEAGIAWLRARRDIDAARIGLLGHSEGGVIAPLVASRDPDVAFVVMWAGPAVDGKTIIADQTRAISQAAGASPQAAEANGQLQARLLEALLSTADFASARAAMSAVLANLDAPPISDASVASMNSPWYRHFLAFDPAPALRSLRIPVLALLGGKDTQVTVELNEAPLRAALAGDPHARVEVIPGVNHLFQTAGTGGPDEYGKIEETMAPQALSAMVDWIVATAGAGN